MNRLNNLDYLRGIAAFGIMIYHYLSWSYGEFEAANFMGRVGLYGVSIFYVLSGLTLHHVYCSKMTPTWLEIRSFFRKRFFRIFPLLWIVTLAAIVLSKQTPDLWDLFLNLTGLFGLLKWDAYFAGGAWSIGNELVFYLFFPFFILFLKRSKALFYVLAALIFAIYVYFAFELLTANQPITAQWRDYVNPLNQVFLFLGGFLIGHFFQQVKAAKAWPLLLVGLGLLLFIFWPSSGDPIHLVTGMNRLVFTAACLLICLGFYKWEITFPSLIHRPFSLLGEASYSVYLIHPLVYVVVGVSLNFLSARGLNLGLPFKLILSISCTLIVSYLVYTYFEKYFMKLGRRTERK